MYKVRFYKGIDGQEPVADYILALSKRSDKDSRIKLNKIRDYIKVLSEYGTQAGIPFVKHVDGAIWELRPSRNRIMYVAWENNTYVLLHIFTKTTRKTPKREIEISLKRYKDLKERGMHNE